jgi:ABC-type nickel/cobalt efflux system permease component RcnA
MSGAVYGTIATAAVLGATHAIEPDHVAGISSLTSRYGDSRLSALAGACFSLGHVALVVLWLGIGYLILGRTSFPAVLDTVGTVGVVILLGVLGVATAGSGVRALLRDRDHWGDPQEGDARHTGSSHAHETAHSHFHVHGDWGHTHSHASGDHDHSVRTYLSTGLVGALFTLSPPMSMILFASTLLSTHGGDAVALAVTAYAVAIVGTMSLIGAGVGALFGAMSVDARTAGIARAFAGLTVAAFAGWMLVGML